MNCEESSESLKLGGGGQSHSSHNVIFRDFLNTSYNEVNLPYKSMTYIPLS